MIGSSRFAAQTSRLGSTRRLSCLLIAAVSLMSLGGQPGPPRGFTVQVRLDSRIADDLEEPAEDADPPCGVDGEGDEAALVARPASHPRAIGRGPRVLVSREGPAASPGWTANRRRIPAARHSGRALRLWLQSHVC
ncbi:MAG: hypothetical protein U0790_08105 [Isosphaeraceae bacterium]